MKYLVKKDIKALDRKSVLLVGDILAMPEKPNGNLVIWVKENVRRGILVEYVEPKKVVKKKVEDKPKKKAVKKVKK